jgi:hypothetical protein
MLDDGTRIEVLCDPEGNGPGFLAGLSTPSSTEVAVPYDCPKCHKTFNDDVLSHYCTAAYGSVMRAPEPCAPSVKDGKIVGMEPDGQLVQYNAQSKSLYVSGENASEFGFGNIDDDELLVLIAAADQLGRKLDRDALKARAHARNLL